MASHPLLDLPPLPLSSNSGSLTPITGAIQVRGAGTVVATDSGDGRRSPGAGTDAAAAGDAGSPYSGGGAGGKVRSSRRASVARSKKTPYTRPASGRHATPSGSAAATSSSSSIALRLVDSASRLISSSATYLFSSFFGRRSPLAIANGDVLSAGLSASEQEPEEDIAEIPVDQADKDDTSPDQALILVGDSARTEKRVIDIEQVEKILKQQTWSREQVNRLTEILQTRVLENGIPKNSEAQRWREDLKKARNDATPIEVARAYMGERTARPSGLATSIQESVHHTDRVADLQPPPGIGLIEDRYRPSPVLRTWARSSGPVRTPRRSSVLDDEWASVGPIRRTRQRNLMLANSSPYARGVTGSSLPPRAFTSPPIQSSQTARKILETLEKLTPSPKGKSLDGETKVATEGLPAELTSNVPKLQEKKMSQVSEALSLPKMTEPGPSSGKLAGEPSAIVDVRAVEKSGTHRTPPFIVGSPPFIPEKSKGFRMSAVFEESNSDEENRLKAKIKLTTSEAQLPLLGPEARESPQLTSLSSVKPSSPPVATTAPVTTTIDLSASTMKSLPSTVPTNVSPISTLTFSTTIQPSGLPAVQSSGTVATSSSVSFTCGGQSGISSSGQFFPTGSLPTSSKATPVSVINGDANISTGSVGISAASSATTALTGVLASSAPPVTCAPIVGDTLPAAAVAPSVVSLDTATAIEDLSEGENGTIMAAEGPGEDKLVDADIMASDPMAEEPDSFAMSSSPPSFTFGSSSAASSTTKMPAFTFGSSSAITSTSSLPSFTFGASSMSSPSTFSFAVQSLGTTATTSPTSFAFGGQSSSSSSPSLFAFGAPSTPPPVSPFSLPRTGNSGSSFSFASSAASSSAPQAFQTTSSPLSTFSMSSSAASSFAFGAHAASSPLSSSSSAGQIFGFGSASTANPFSTAGAGNSSPAFTFSSTPAPVSSAAPTFSFGAGPGTSASPGSSFGGQSFGFGAQLTPPASPFSPAGPPTSAPAFQFMSSSAVSETPSLSFGSSAASTSSPTFAFGAQSVVPPASSTPFMFGGQPSATSVPQPFAFGGQPSGPASSPFSSPGPSNTFSQPAMEFTGGFALGATGGEKSGRKYIKAKRRK